MHTCMHTMRCMCCRAQAPRFGDPKSFTSVCCVSVVWQASCSVLGMQPNVGGESLLRLRQETDN